MLKSLIRSETQKLCDVNLFKGGFALIFMKHRPFTFWKIVVIAVIIIALVISVLLSLQSVTGYFISEEVNEPANLLASGFFLIGIFGAMYYLAKLR